METFEKVYLTIKFCEKLIFVYSLVVIPYLRNSLIPASIILYYVLVRNALVMFATFSILLGLVIFVTSIMLIHSLRKVSI